MFPQLHRSTWEAAIPVLQIQAAILVVVAEEGSREGVGQTEPIKRVAPLSLQVILSALRQFLPAGNCG